MKYVVLSRRYRPQRFQDVIGQDAILATLKNALKFDRIAHAYLFCGSRGIGKTTLARLFAKSLNCQNLKEDFEPCNECASCREILSGQSLDVIEIDGASNRGIDDIRQINESVGYAPSHGKYKIYIIDEVHMLTKEAFNALLKTLEEPPERAKFFFATTEPHKVLPTIVSRCQRFDLKRLSEEQIIGKLKKMVSELGRQACDEAVHLLASFADGSLRDAESLLDQILCFVEGAVSADHVRNILGLVPDEIFFSLDRAFSEGRIGFAFELTEQIFQMGSKDLCHFTEQLIGHYRRLAILKTTGPQSLFCTDALLAQLQSSAKLYTQGQLFHLLDILPPALLQLQKSPVQRVSFESLLLQILRSKHRIPIEILVRHLHELEQKLLSLPSDSTAPALENEPIAQVISESNDRSPSEALPEEAPPRMIETAPSEFIAPQPLQSEPSTAPALKTKAPPAAACNLQPAPFDPFPRPAETREPILEQPAAPEPVPSSHTKQTHPVSPLPQQVKEPESIASKTQERDPRRHETLLRFAAVELEGTLKIGSHHG